MNARVVLSSPSDAVAVAPTMFGFQPVESVVVLGIRGHVMVLSARADICDALDSAPRILTAAADCGVERFELIGYSQQPATAAATLEALSSGPFDGIVGEQYVTDYTHAWRVHDGVLLDKEPFIVPDTLPLPTAAREDAVAAVTEPRTPAPMHTISDRLVSLTEDQQLAELWASIVSDTPLTATDAALAAGVLHGATSAVNLVIDAIHDDPPRPAIT